MEEKERGEGKGGNRHLVEQRQHIKQKEMTGVKRNNLIRVFYVIHASVLGSCDFEQADKHLLKMN